MSSVLGVSVGASAVRLAHPEFTNRERGRFLSQAVDHSGRPEESAAESIGVVLTGDADPGRVQRAGVAYRDEVQAGAVHAAMARQNLRNYQLVPEIKATLWALEHAGVLGAAQTPLIYDLGSSGLTISVVDRASGDVIESLRTDVVGGDLFDRIVRDNQVSAERLRAPRTEAESRALDAQCRTAKEQLSHSGAVCVPGGSGLLLLSRDVFDSLVTVAVESSARLVRDVVSRLPRTPDVLVLVGGGAHIPLVRSILESWIALPVVVPEFPELVAAQGAALLVGSQNSNGVQGAVPDAESEPDWGALLAESETEQTRGPRRRKTAAVVGSVAVLGVLGVGVAVGAVMIPTPTVGEAVPAVPTQTLQPTTPAPTTTPSPEPTPPPADLAPIRTQRPQPSVQAPEPPPPPPPPPPGLVIPGLPPIQLPPLQLPELPRFPR